MSLQKLIEERSEKFDKLMQDLPVNTQDLFFEGLDGSKIPTLRLATIKQFNRETVALILDGVVEMVNEYQEFCEKTKDECLEKKQILIAYDMDSRQVAAQHLISQLQTLKKRYEEINQIKI